MVDDIEPHEEDCPVCRGSGGFTITDDNDEDQDFLCPVCLGSGVVLVAPLVDLGDPEKQE